MPVLFALNWFELGKLVTWGSPGSTPRWDYNRVRPHSSLDNLTPTEFVKQAESAPGRWAAVA